MPEHRKHSVSMEAGRQEMGILRRRVGAEMTGRLFPSCTTKDRLMSTASSSRPYSGSMAVREEEVLDGAGEDSHASKDVVGELGAGTGIGDGDR